MLATDRTPPSWLSRYNHNTLTYQLSHSLWTLTAFAFTHSAHAYSHMHYLLGAQGSMHQLWCGGQWCSRRCQALCWEGDIIFLLTGRLVAWLLMACGCNFNRSYFLWFYLLLRSIKHLCFHSKLISRSWHSPSRMWATTSMLVSTSSPVKSSQAHSARCVLYGMAWYGMVWYGIDAVLSLFHI